ncbi:MAG: hypothetical protein ED559_12125 [Phycisphaera sp.]|nr:MAG: hypothetical protein ED559_12125 [Phycisphaera sp.]
MPTTGGAIAIGCVKSRPDIPNRCVMVSIAPKPSPVLIAQTCDAFGASQRWMGTPSPIEPRMYASGNTLAVRIR